MDAKLVNESLNEFMNGSIIPVIEYYDISADYEDEPWTILGNDLYEELEEKYGTIELYKFDPYLVPSSEINNIQYIGDAQKYPRLGKNILAGYASDMEGQFIYDPNGDLAELGEPIIIGESGEMELVPFPSI